MKFFARCLLLTFALALTTAGLMSWQDQQFRLHDLWPFSGPLELHPVHLLTVGLTLIPLTLWEIFLLFNPLPSAAPTRPSTAAPPTTPPAAAESRHD